MRLFAVYGRLVRHVSPVSVPFRLGWSRREMRQVSVGGRHQPTALPPMLKGRLDHQWL